MRNSSIRTIQPVRFVGEVVSSNMPFRPRSVSRYDSNSREVVKGSTDDRNATVVGDTVDDRRRNENNRCALQTRRLKIDFLPCRWNVGAPFVPYEQFTIQFTFLGFNQ